MDWESMEQARRQSARAFTLAELAVCTVIVSLLALSVGVATFRSRQRVDRTREVYSQRHRQDVLRNLARRLQFATELDCLSSDALSGDIPDLEAADNSTIHITLYYDPVGETLYYCENHGVEEPLVSHIADFSFGWTTVTIGHAGGTRVGVINMIAQLGDSAESKITVAANLINRPEKP